jgi:hypothetical protein
MTAQAPHFTLVIPIYNEENILEASVVELVERLGTLGKTYEIVLAENGSIDRTLAIAGELSRRFPQVRYFSTGEPGNGNYGKALRRAILEARGEFVLCDEIDLCDVGFHRAALDLLERREVDLVIGSSARSSPTVPPTNGRSCATSAASSSTACCASRSTSREPTRTDSRHSGARSSRRSPNAASSTVTCSPANW